MRKQSHWMLFIAVILVVIVVWYYLGYCIAGPDRFISSESLFTGLAFAALVATLFLQRSELVLQREELSHARVIMERQRDQMELQNSTLALQRFENTFFQMIRLHHEIVGALRGDGMDRREGRQIIEAAYDAFAQQYKKVETSGNSDWIRISRAYENMWPGYGRNLEHYFRNLHILIEFVDRAQIENSDRSFYAVAISSQLSNYELLLIFYNCTSERGRHSLELFDRMKILRFVPQSMLCDRGHTALFKNTTFEKD
jgi:hypothetical protein